LGKNRARLYSSRDRQAQMELDWPNIEETNISHNLTLEWNPHGKRKVGRPVKTWRRSVDEELKEANITWNRAKRSAANRVRWRSIVSALCSTRCAMA